MYAVLNRIIVLSDFAMCKLLQNVFELRGDRFGTSTTRLIQDEGMGSRHRFSPAFVRGRHAVFLHPIPDADKDVLPKVCDHR